MITNAQKKAIAANENIFEKQELKQLSKAAKRILTVGELVEQLKGMPQHLPVQLNIIDEVTKDCSGTSSTFAYALHVEEMDCGTSLAHVGIEGVLTLDLVEPYLKFTDF